MMENRPGHGLLGDAKLLSCIPKTSGGPKIFIKHGRTVSPAKKISKYSSIFFIKIGCGVGWKLGRVPELRDGWIRLCLKHCIYFLTYQILDHSCHYFKLNSDI
jgi:hypothetical protein